MYPTLSKLAIKTPKPLYWSHCRRSNFTYCFGNSIVVFEQVYANWDKSWESIRFWKFYWPENYEKFAEFPRNMQSVIHTFFLGLLTIVHNCEILCFGKH